MPAAAVLSQIGIAAIVLAALGGILLRPFGLREPVWAVAGAALLVLCGLLPPGAALRAAGQGTNVYLFLIGMMLLAELAALHGVFDWAASHVGRAARGSAVRLFVYVYALAVLITALLSNDATAVVFTPAVAAMARQAKVADRLPYLLVCAFVANAASFILPISNPANLVVYGADLPDLAAWLRLFAWPSAVAVAATFLLLLATQAGGLRQRLAVPAPVGLPPGGRLALAALGGMAAVQLTASAQGWPLGLPTFLTGAAATALLGLRRRNLLAPVLRGVSWGMLLLTAGLFVMMGALAKAGLAAVLARAAAGLAPLPLGGAIAILCNLINNLPVGLLAGQALQGAATGGAATGTRAAALVAVDLGPNLSITGSLATLLWLAALRRQGERVSGWRFLRLGLVMMPPALLLALYALRFTV